MTLTNPPSGPGSGSAGAGGGSGVRTHQSLKRGVQAAFDGTYLDCISFSPLVLFISLSLPRAASWSLFLDAHLVLRPLFIGKSENKLSQETAAFDISTSVNVACSLDNLLSS